MRAADVEKEFELGNPRAKVLRTISNSLTPGARGAPISSSSAGPGRHQPSPSGRPCRRTSIVEPARFAEQQTRDPTSAESWLSLREPPALLGQPMAIVFSHPEGEAASTLAVIVSSMNRCYSWRPISPSSPRAHHSAKPFRSTRPSLAGRRLGDLGAGEWALPQLTSLLKATASGNAQIEAYEIELDGRAMRRDVCC